MRTLLIWMGEVGTALAEVLKQYDPICYDIKKSVNVYESPDIMHICFPYSESFVERVLEYQKVYRPKYTVIHSTVPVGISSKCEATHSPIRGIHPFLTEGIKTFVKFLGGPQASEVADYFRRAGLRVYVCDSAETTEALKIFDTTYYALCIEFHKHIKQFSNEIGFPFEAWTLYNEDYNTGYKQLGYPEYVRPNLVPIMKNQGGHCTLNNCEFMDTPFTKLIKELNE